MPLRQGEIRAEGHAVEARLYAEDPARGFLPSTGTLRRLSLPRGVRVDTGVEEGDAVTPFYDPMVAKIIAHGPSRAAALDRLAEALDVTQVEGVTTNLAFLRAAAASPAFRELAIDTGWLDREGTAALVEEPEAGEGTIMTWDGDEVGVGKMTLVESKPDEAVKIKVTFTEPFEGGTNSDFSFKPNGDQTDVAWAMHGTHNFVQKAFCLVMNGLGMMGDDLEKGLSQLKSVVEQG